MNFNDQDDELSRLIQAPDSMIRVIPGGIENNGRVNPVQRHRHQQPQLGPFQLNNRRPDMPAN